MSRSRRFRSPHEDPCGNLLHVAEDRRYRIEMTNGEILRGDLLDIAPDGSSSIRLDDGAVIIRHCDQMLRLTEVEPDGPVKHGPG
jgi:hypothetical protein